MGGVGLHTITGLASLAIGALTNNPTAIIEHDNISKAVHLFTKCGLQRLNYKMQEMKYAFSPGKKINLKNPYQVKMQARGEFYMRAVAQITSAAPTYFPPVLTFLDGGILQNNPAIPCIVSAIEKNVSPNLFLVSLGTGLNSENAIVKDFESLGASAWFQAVQNDMAEQELLKEMLESQNYKRLQYNFIGQEAPSLDDHTPEVIHALEDAGKKLVEDNLDEIIKLCNILNFEGS